MASNEVAERKLDDFTHFPRLPLEIQLKIWKYAVPGPRVIKVKVFAPQTIFDPDYPVPRTIIHSVGGWPFFRSSESEREEMQKAIQGLVLSTETKSPGLLFACQVSRAVGLKLYTVCLRLGCGKETRFDPENDIIFLSHAAKYHLQPLPGCLRGIEDRVNLIDTFSGVRNLAISGFTILKRGMSDEKTTWLISRFQSLKSLFVLVNEVHYLTTSLDSLPEPDEQLRLHTLDEQARDTSERIDGWCAAKAQQWKEWATGPRGDKSYVTDWENLQVKPAILITGSARL